MIVTTLPFWPLPVESSENSAYEYGHRHLVPPSCDQAQLVPRRLDVDFQYGCSIADLYCMYGYHLATCRIWYQYDGYAKPCATSKGERVPSMIKRSSLTDFSWIVDM